MDKRSHQRSSIRKVVLENFAKFIGEHLCQAIFFNKVAYRRPATLFEKKILMWLFSCEFYEISKSKYVYRIPPMPAAYSFVYLRLPECNQSFSKPHYVSSKSLSFFKGARNLKLRNQLILSQLLYLCGWNQKCKLCPFLKNELFKVGGTEVWFVFQTCQC